MKPGDIVLARGVAAQGKTGSLEYQILPKELYCCLLLGFTTLKDLPRRKDQVRMMLSLGLVSFGEIEEILGPKALKKLTKALDQKHLTVSKI